MPGHTPCIVCDSPNVFRVVELPPLPIDTNRLWASRAAARAAPKARLILAHCNDCGQIFNCNYNDDLVNYEVDYENSQIFSPRFRRYAEELADTLIARHDLRHKHIVEIGGGTGDFLRIICDRGDNLGVSIGPSYSAEPGKDIPSNVRFIKDYYTAKYVDEPADIIICRHVLEHFWQRCEKPPINAAIWRFILRCPTGISLSASEHSGNSITSMFHISRKRRSPSFSLGTDLKYAKFTSSLRVSSSE